MVLYRATPDDVGLRRRRRRPRVPRLPGQRRDGRGRQDRRSGGARGFFRAALRPGLRTRRSGCSPATKRATPRAPTSTFARFRSRSNAAGSSSTIASSIASCRPFSRGRPRSSRRGTRWRSSWSSTASCAGRTPQRLPRSRRRRRRRCCGAAWCSIRSRTPPSSPRSPITAPTSTRARKSIKQMHLGFDLASYRRQRRSSPRTAAKSLYADELGIYGNCVIIDHGMGVQSLYGHLSSIDVKVGRLVEKGQPLGRSGMTGLAGGDHLHFTMLVNGRMVNPGRMVGFALDRGSHPAQAERRRPARSPPSAVRSAVRCRRPFPFVILRKLEAGSDRVSCSSMRTHWKSTAAASHWWRPPAARGRDSAPARTPPPDAQAGGRVEGRRPSAAA